MINRYLIEKGILKRSVQVMFTSQWGACNYYMTMETCSPQISDWKFKMISFEAD